MKKKLDVRIRLIAAAAILAAGAAVYSNSLHGKFVWDDKEFIVHNRYIRDATNTVNIFTHHLGSGASVESDVYRPLQEYTYLLDYAFWKLNVVGYHLTNVLLHLLVALCVYWLAAVLFKDALLSFLAGILFVIFPVQTGVVSYISARADILSALGMLLCIILYIRYLDRRDIYPYLGMVAAYIAALLSKENALAMPLLLLLYHYAFKKKMRLAGLLPIVGIACVYVLARMSALTHVYQGKVFLLQRIPGFFAALAGYLRILLLPVGLHMEYGNRLFSIFSPKALWGLAVLSAALIYALRCRNKHTLQFFSISWFFIALLPTTGIYPATAFYMAEHWLYLPSVGFFFLVAYALSSLYRTKKFKAGALCIIVCLVAGYSVLTIRQNRYWEDPVAFYKRTLYFAPWSARIHYNLGIEYSEKKDSVRAVEEYKRAIALDGKMAPAYYNLGTEYLEIQEYGSAIGAFKEAIRYRPAYADAFNNLCNSYIAIGKDKEAVDCCKKAIALSPAMATAHYNLGNAYYNLGEKRQALQETKNAIRLNPSYVEAYNNLASLYSEEGNIDEAIALWNKAVELNPAFMVGHLNLAVFYFQKKQYELAIRHSDRVLELGGQVDPAFLEQLRRYRSK